MEVPIPLPAEPQSIADPGPRGKPPPAGHTVATVYCSRDTAALQQQTQPQSGNRLDCCRSRGLRLASRSDHFSGKVANRLTDPTPPPDAELAALEVVANNSSASRADRVAALLRLGPRLGNQPDTARTLAAWQTLLELTQPGETAHGEALLQLGNLYEALGQHPQAINCWTQIIDDARYPPELIEVACLYRGVRHLQQEDSAAAKSDFSLGLAAKGTSSHIRGMLHLGRADALDDLKAYAAAEADYRQAIATLDADRIAYADASIKLGIMRFRHHRDLEAYELLDQDLACRGIRREAWLIACYNSGSVRAETGQFTESLPYFNKIIAAADTPKHMRMSARIGRGNALRQLRKTISAIKDLEHVVESPDSDPAQRAESYMLLAICHAGTEEHSATLRNLSAGLSTDEGVAVNWFHAAEILRINFGGLWPSRFSPATDAADCADRFPTILETAGAGYETAAGLWAQPGSNWDWHHEMLVTLVKYLPPSLMLYRLQMTAKKMRYDQAADIASHARAIVDLQFLGQTAERVAAWIESGQDGGAAKGGAAGKRAGLLARVELMLGDPVGSADRLDADFEAREQADRRATLQHRLTLVRALWSPAGTAMEAAADREWEDAVAEVRARHADGSLGGRAAAAAAMLLLCEGEAQDLALAEEIYRSAGEDPGMGYLGWWLARELDHDEAARQRLAAAVAEDIERMRQRRDGWLPHSEFELADGDPGPETLARLAHHLRRDDMAWVYGEVWASDDLERLTREDAAVAAWCGQIGWSTAQEAQDGYAARQEVWREDRRRARRLAAAQRGVPPERLEAERDRLRGSCQTLGVAVVDMESMPSTEVVGHLARQLHDRPLTDAQCKWPHVIRLLHREQRLNVWQAISLMMYGLYKRELDLSRRTASLYRRASLDALAGLVVGGAASAEALGGAGGGGVGVAGLMSGGAAATVMDKMLALGSQWLDLHQHDDRAAPTYDEYMRMVDEQLGRDGDYQRLQEMALLRLDDDSRDAGAVVDL